LKAIQMIGLPSNPSIALEQLGTPVISQPNEVLIRVLAVGLDGTDREILQEKYGMPPEGETRLTFGHEMLGVVVEVGAEASYRPGDLVTATVRRPCKILNCVNCRNGHTDFCETGQYVERGIKEAHGFLAEYITEDERYVIQIPKESLSYGMLAEPQSIVEKVWDQIQRVQQRLIWEPKTVLVLGSGPLGILAAMTYRVLGLHVYVWSISSEESEQAQLVQACGAIYQRAGGASAVAGTAVSAVESITQFAELLNIHIDVIMECTGYSPLAFEAMSVLGPNGVLALLGVTPGNRKLEISADVLNQSIVLENKCIVGSVNASRKDFETGIYRLQKIEEQYPGILQKLLSDRLSIEEVAQMDFSKLAVKAVVDLVPPHQWESLIKQTEEVAYSFSV
jgi:threonine dehydrogenase-like Zn-dependent dehydrogenase